MEKVELFMLPFAGGNTASFRGFLKHQGLGVNMNFLELPGRGARVREPLLDNIAQMTDDMFAQVSARMPFGPYAIYGHSMGALLAFLLFRKLQQEKLMLPVHLFLSGCASPTRIRLRERLHLLPRREFIQALHLLDGSPREILEDQHVMDFFEPILRADFKAIETYTFDPGPMLDVPIDIFIGDQENITPDDARAWSDVTSGDVTLTVLPGKHFFIYRQDAVIMKHIQERLRMFNSSMNVK